MQDIVIRLRSPKNGHEIRQVLRVPVSSPAQVNAVLTREVLTLVNSCHMEIGDSIDTFLMEPVEED